jgi:hypothetical protein
MMKADVFISAVPVSGYRQLMGSEASEVLMTKFGMTHVFIDDNGIFHALSKENKVLEGYRIYERFSVVTMEEK